MTDSHQQANLSINVSAKPKPEVAEETEEEQNDGPSYWLMKAEPETRIEKGRDVKFSIDDLKAATSPEGWDGVRNYVGKSLRKVYLYAGQIANRIFST